jgi:hypothetical protein
MKQRVFVIGPDVASLVPYGVVFPSGEYDITLIQTADVAQRALELTSRRDAWCLLLDPGGAPLAGLDVTGHLVVSDVAGPLAAVAHLVAASYWDQALPEQRVEPLERQHG